MQPSFRSSDFLKNTLGGNAVPKTIKLESTEYFLTQKNYTWYTLLNIYPFLLFLISGNSIRTKLQLQFLEYFSLILATLLKNMSNLKPMNTYWKLLRVFCRLEHTFLIILSVWCSPWLTPCEGLMFLYR